MRNGGTATDDDLAANVEALKAGKDTILWSSELPGFGVRVYPNGTKVYVVQVPAAQGCICGADGDHEQGT